MAHRRPAPARALALAALGALLATTVTACADGTAAGPGAAGTSPGGLPASAPDGARPTFLTHRPATCPFPTRSAHGLQVSCSELVVPMDRGAPAGGRTVTLAVARVHATGPDPRADPVVYLEGGPGGSALSSIDVWTDPPAPFLARRDLVLVDQRGTGYSTPRLTCEGMSDDLYGAAAVQTTETCVRALRNTGVELDAFDTDESAADLVDLRRALGVARWNLFGISYGTRLALWTLHRDPGGTRSVVLDSVYPPGAKLVETVGAGFVRALRAIGSDCATQPACASAHPDLVGELAGAVDRLEAAEAGAGAAFTRLLFQSMYATPVAAVVPRAVGLAAAGRAANAGAVLRQAQVGTGGDAAPGITTRPHMSGALYQSVECAETAPTTSPTAIRAAAGSLPAALAGPFVANDLRMMAVCNVWGVAPDPLEPVRSDVPALVLAGGYDPVTPPAWAEEAAATLSRSRYQLVAGSGHGTWLAGDCPRQLVSSFLDDPAAPGPDCPGSVPAFAP